MDLKELYKYVNITSNGAILISDDIAIDGHHDGRILRIITHIHSDHTIGISSSIKKMKYILATPQTHDMLSALGYRIPLSKRIALNYGQEMEINDKKISLIRAEHIPGAAQVHVKLREGIEIGYTGDFKNPGAGTPVLKDMDILIMEATYGKPEWTRPFRDEVEYLFIDIVKYLLSHGPIIIYAYHGKLQEAMRILRIAGITAPFIASRATYRIVKVLEKYGYRFGEVLYDESREAKEVMKSGWYIYFTHVNSYNYIMSAKHRFSKIILSGWEFDQPYRKINNNTWIVALSDHADFEHLLLYVEEARPRILVIDASRCEAAEIFAREVTRRLGISAIPLPLRRPIDLSISQYMSTL